MNRGDSTLMYVSELLVWVGVLVKLMAMRCMCVCVLSALLKKVSRLHVLSSLEENRSSSGADGKETSSGVRSRQKTSRSFRVSWT